MKLVLVPLAATAALATPFLLSSARPTPAPGAYAVLEMHKQLFAALDAGRADEVAAFVDPSKRGGLGDGEDGGIAHPSVVLVGVDGAPAFAQGAEAVAAAMRELAKEDGLPPWTTRIVRSRSDCASAESSYAVLEIERTRGVKGGTKRFRSTSLVRHVDGKWKLFHWHVSPVEPRER